MVIIIIQTRETNRFCSSKTFLKDENRLKMFLHSLIIFILIIKSIDMETSTIVQEETRLMRQLLNEKLYLKKVRPSHTVVVDIRFVFNQIVSMVEKEQIIVTNCFVDQKWTDPRLSWNPSDFSNITWLRMPATSVWYPDTFLYNTADNAGFLLPQDSQNVIVSHNGTIFWPLPLAQLRTRCRMVIKHFPFDEQTCDMVFGSWSHTSSLIHYQFWEKTPELPQYTPNNEWKLLAVSQSMKTILYPNWVEPDTFFEINFSILIVRKPLQAIYNTVVPALMLTTLTLVSFFIPFPQEMQIGISIMLAYSVFSLRLSEDVPSQSDSVHLISLYLTVCMFFSLSAMTWFAIANKLREKKRLPNWLRWLALKYLSWIVCAQSMHRKARRTLKSETATTATRSSVPFEREHHQTGSMKLPILPTTMNNINNNNETQLSLNNPPSSATVWVRRPMVKTPATASNGPDVWKMVEDTLKKTRGITDPTRKNQESLYAIHIINRLFFLIFLSFVIVFNIYTWFIYSRSIQTKLFDNETNWTCFDEVSSSVIPCQEKM